MYQPRRYIRFDDWLAALSPPLTRDAVVVVVVGIIVIPPMLLSETISVLRLVVLSLSRLRHSAMRAHRREDEPRQTAGLDYRISGLFIAAAVAWIRERLAKHVAATKRSEDPANPGPEWRNPRGNVRRYASFDARARIANQSD